MRIKYLVPIFFAHEEMGGPPESWYQWVGSWHLVLLHFPIALITMAVVAEGLRFCLKREFPARFLLLSAAILSPITALLGWVYSHSFTYEGLMDTYLHWHMWLGITTAVLSIWIVCIRERSPLYYLLLSALFMLVCLVGYFGGAMTFGMDG